MDRPIGCRTIQAQSDWNLDRISFENHSNSTQRGMPHSRQSCILLKTKRMAYQSQLITIDDKDNDSNWQHNQSAWSVTSFGAIPPWTRWVLAQITAGLNAGKWIRNGKAAALMCAPVNVVNFAPIHQQNHLQFRRAQPNIICREHSFGIVDYVIDIQIPFPFMNGTFGCSSLIHFNCESAKLKDATQRNSARLDATQQQNPPKSPF